MHEKKKRNIEDIPLLDSYIVLTIIVAVTLIWGEGGESYTVLLFFLLQMYYCYFELLLRK